MGKKVSLIKIFPLIILSFFVLSGLPLVYAEDTHFFVSVHIEPVNAGTVDLMPSMDIYPSGSTITMRAMPNTGYTFLRWECSENLNPIHYSPHNPEEIYIDGHKSITAVFRTIPSNTCKLVLLNDPAQGGHITVSPEPTERISDTILFYPRNTAVTFTAVPNTDIGYQFASFEYTYISNDGMGGGSRPTNPYLLVINSDTEMTAQYTDNTNIIPGFELVNILSCLAIISIALYFTKKKEV